MMNEQKKYKLSIAGGEYTVISDEPQELIVKSADMVDSLMKELLMAAPKADQQKIAVLVALQLASKLYKAELQVADKSEHEKSLLNQIDQFISSISSS